MKSAGSDLEFEAGRVTSTVEEEVVGLFMSLTQVLGVPKSLGAIYGFLFVSPEPVAFEEVARTLHLSSGSVSQGLRALKTFGAIRVIFLRGDRRDHYVAETRLRHLVAGFLREGVEGHLLRGQERLDRLEGHLTTSSLEQVAVSPLLAARVHTLRNWHTRAKAALPSLLKAIETPVSVP